MPDYNSEQYISSDCDVSCIKNRISDWKSFKLKILNTVNHRVQSTEYIFEKEVFSMSVDEFHNFATDTCFIHSYIN